ncbi:unnamed protein product, partial [Prorocentrum cordatum]
RLAPRARASPRLGAPGPRLGGPAPACPRMGDEPAAKRPRPSGAALRLAARALRPEQLVFGGSWLAPGADDAADVGQDAADEAVAAAAAAGVREFDTAPWYGAGAGEERLGRAVAGLPASSGARIFTKTGRLVRMPDGVTPCTVGAQGPAFGDRVFVNDYTAEGAAASHADSLARLGADRVHGLRVHDPNDNSTWDGSTDEVAAALAPGGMLEGLRRLRAEGKIEHVSLGMNCHNLNGRARPEEVLRLLRGAPRGTFDSALLAGGWNLLTQDRAVARASPCTSPGSSLPARSSAWTATPTRGRRRRSSRPRAGGGRSPPG